MRIQHEATITIDHTTTFNDIYESVVAAEIPLNAKVDVYRWEGDQHDPSYTNLKFHWETGS
jgi:hypothetical protein